MVGPSSVNGPGATAACRSRLRGLTAHQRKVLCSLTVQGNKAARERAATMHQVPSRFVVPCIAQHDRDACAQE